MASEYTKNFNLDLYTDTDKPNLRDQYKAAMEKIDSELQKKTNDITAAEVLIENEVTARKNADTAINSKIDEISGTIAAETEARTAADTKLTNDLAAETEARTAADTKLTNDLAAETDARTAADTKLTNDLAAETEARTAANTKLTNDLAAETEARTAADDAINQEIALLRNLDDVVIEDIKDSDYGTKWMINDLTPKHANREEVALNAIKIMHANDNFGVLLGTLFFDPKHNFTLNNSESYGLVKIPGIKVIEAELYFFSIGGLHTNKNAVRVSNKDSSKASTISFENWTGSSEEYQPGWSRATVVVPFTLYE